MLFYRYSYFSNQNDFEFYLKLSLSVIIASLIIIFFVQYLRHRSDSKYRDLLIIFGLVGILLAGIQYTRIQQLNTAHSQQAQMAQFIRSVATAQKASLKTVAVNTTSLQQNMVVRVGHQNYQVIFDNNFTSYQLQKAQLISQDITYQDFRSVATAQKASLKTVAVNTTSLQQNMVVRVGHQNYQVIFDNNFTSYQLQKAQLISQDITYQD
ncbi:DUF3290 domain-containing protein [Latilactobacillus curvatus]|nr:DUF3290 domain-containing protein [Latilactobacillus curvatus]QWF35674.1 DUF3290 domain-containing protein [Latilactobacillus curvatus]